MTFPKLLGLRPGVTAVIGSGGKTSLLRRLAEELPGTVLLCTTTHIRPFEESPLLTAPTPEDIRKALMEKLVGHSAFRTDEEAEKFKADQKAKRAAAKAAKAEVEED